MRKDHKPVAKIGHARGVGYRNGLFSAGSDLEALVDVYNIDDLIIAMRAIHSEIREHGDAINNGAINMWLNMQPLPRIRKQNKKKQKKAA